MSKNREARKLHKFLKRNGVGYKHKKSKGDLNLWQQAVKRLTDLFKIGRK
jgi:hypothetical protein